MCKILNLATMEVELDAKVVYGWITKEYNCSLVHGFLILDCKTLIIQIY